MIRPNSCRIRFSAVSIVSPLTDTGPRLGIRIVPSGETFSFRFSSESPQTLISNSSPADKTYPLGVGTFRLGSKDRFLFENISRPNTVPLKSPDGRLASRWASKGGITFPSGIATVRSVTTASEAVRIACSVPDCPIRLFISRRICSSVIPAAFALSIKSWDTCADNGTANHSNPPNNTFLITIFILLFVLLLFRF